MDKKSKILLLTFIILIVISIIITYKKYLIDNQITFFVDPNNIPSGWGIIKNFLMKT